MMTITVGLIVIQLQWSRRYF